MPENFISISLAINNIREKLMDFRKRVMSSNFSRWEEFAREEGLLEGLHEREKHGEAKALLGQGHQAKYGPSSLEVSCRVQAADLAQQEVWFTRILTAAAPDEVFALRWAWY